MKLHAGPDDRGLRLDVFIARYIENLTRSQIQLLNRAGSIQIDGRQEKAGYKIRGKETIDIDLNRFERPPLKPEHIPLQIHFEDGDLAVIEKPAGMVAHPGSSTKTGTLVHALLFHFQNLSDAGGEGRPGIVHRLDKKTSGLMIIAKNNIAHAKLSKAFHDRQIQKTYLALVHGKPRKSIGIIDLNIARHKAVRTRMAAGRNRGRRALSEYRTLEEFRGFTLLEVAIQTGRTHQIRVHLSAIGHPVVGDDVYGPKTFQQFTTKYGQLGRYFLHAASLKFTHPVTGVALEFHSPLPEELQKVLERIK